MLTSIIHIDPLENGAKRKGSPLQSPGRLDTDDREPRHPVDDRLRTRCFVYTQGQRQETEDARDGAKTDASHQKQLQGYEDEVHLVVHGKSMALRLELTQTRLGLVGGVGGTVSLLGDPRQLLAPVAIVIGSLYRFVFPLIAAVSDFGQWAHDTLSGQAPLRRATGDHSISCGMHQQSERGGRLPMPATTREKGTE